MTVSLVMETQRPVMPTNSRIQSSHIARRIPTNDQLTDLPTFLLTKQIFWSATNFHTSRYFIENHEADHLASRRIFHVLHPSSSLGPNAAAAIAERTGSEPPIHGTNSHCRREGISRRRPTAAQCPLPDSRRLESRNTVSEVLVAREVVL